MVKLHYVSENADIWTFAYDSGNSSMMVREIHALASMGDPSFTKDDGDNVNTVIKYLGDSPVTNKDYAELEILVGEEFGPQI